MSSIPDDLNAVLARIDDQCYTDAEILATARDLVPALVAEVKRLRIYRDASTSSGADYLTKLLEMADKVAALVAEVKRLREENAELDAESHRIYASRAKMRTAWSKLDDEIKQLRADRDALAAENERLRAKRKRLAAGGEEYTETESGSGRYWRRGCCTWTREYLDDRYGITLNLSPVAADTAGGQE